MNHADQTINIYNYDENVWESPEDFEDEFDGSVINGNCDYMVVDVVQITVK
jgi:hypothetical protein